jgi:NAD(P)H-dependent flavin oxidoreductase YrpB (nitropropane dioxygenase family)
MGAGIPKDIPRHLKALCQHQGADLNIQISEGTAVSPFIPPAWTVGLPPLRRPGFLAIISSDVLAASLARVDGVDGFIVEAPTAGGHNAPPRDKGAEPDGTPIYGPRDVPNLERLRKLGKPFWLAGGCASIERLAASQAEGAVGVQVGTAFAFCAESGMDPTIRRAAVKAVLAGTARIVTSGTASPTGFPFKVVEGPGVPVVGPRKRVTCSLGYLRSAYRKPDGAVGWRCPSEPEAQWIAKGGEPAATAGRTCVCHGLLSTIGHAHVHADGSFEGPLLTAGDALLELGDLFPADGSDYTAADVLERVLGR